MAVVSEAEYAKLEAPYQKLYSKLSSGGGYLLKVKGVRVGEADYALEDVAGLRSTVSTLRDEVHDLGQGAKAFKGLDPEAARRALDLVKSLDGMSPEDKAKKLSKEQLDQISEKHRGELKSKDDELLAERGKSKAFVLDAAANAALAGSKVRKATRRAVRDELKSHLDAVVDDEGQYRVFVKDQRGKPQMSKRTGQTGDMEPEEYLSEILGKDPEWSFAFEGSGAAGSGVVEDGPGGSGRNVPTDTSQMSPFEKLKAARAASSAGAQT